MKMIFILQVFMSLLIAPLAWSASWREQLPQGIFAGSISIPGFHVTKETQYVQNGVPAEREVLKTSINFAFKLRGDEKGKIFIALDGPGCVEFEVDGEGGFYVACRLSLLGDQLNQEFIVKGQLDEQKRLWLRYFYLKEVTVWPLSGRRAESHVLEGPYRNPRYPIDVEALK